MSLHCFFIDAISNTKFFHNTERSFLLYSAIDYFGEDSMFQTLNFMKRILNNCQVGRSVIRTEVFFYAVQTTYGEDLLFEVVVYAYILSI